MDNHKLYCLKDFTNCQYTITYYIKHVAKAPELYK